MEKSNKKMAEGGEIIEMEPLDHETRIDDETRITSTSFVDDEEELSNRIKTFHEFSPAIFSGDKVIENLEDKLPEHIKSQNRNIYFPDASVEIQGEEILVDAYPDGGINR